ncbi:hypothetical protein B0T21DRAFT_367812 [Apiosordaria backusii]|uniref:Uncharacterized protein n=1 Tax=Apiosordaria backusii TaxID=314023 RepID=A0AA40BJU5_9PEZI|nr:hypothetical protein B0T21DRAFT_367812 [Apiosordaria backusii]
MTKKRSKRILSFPSAQSCNTSWYQPSKPTIFPPSHRGRSLNSSHEQSLWDQRTPSKDSPDPVPPIWCLHLRHLEHLQRSPSPFSGLFWKLINF